MLALLLLLQTVVVPTIPPCPAGVAMCITVEGHLYCLQCVPDMIFRDGFEPPTT
jgi:hypothetical protein